MSNQNQGIVATLVDGVRVTVPDDIRVISTFVLFEQHDWFESELPFLRKLLQPGNYVVDIGASYGTYSLSLANRVGPTGRVWAFEPNPNVAVFLEHSIQNNGFQNVVLDRRGVAGDTASMFFTKHPHSECRGLSATMENASEFSVQTVSLDQWMSEHSWERIDFLKIDAEGFERPVLEGAIKFLTHYSPLVLYEVQQGDGTIDHELPKLFETQGIESYRLVPGLDLLVPVDSTQSVSKYVINFFGCDQRRAELLRSTGMVLTKRDLDSNEVPALRESLLNSPSMEVDELCEKFPFSRSFHGEWSRKPGATTPELLKILSLYELSRSTERSGLERWIALNEAAQRMTVLAEQHSTAQRLSMLARMLLDLGHRAEAVTRMNQAWQASQTTSGIELSEPFLPCVPRFDHVIPVEDPSVWFQASIMEWGERWGNFSSYYNPEDAKVRLEYLHQVGYLADDLARRRELLSLVKRLS